ncbi:MAG: hypothetical protein HY306_07045 [Nitrosomonadales bacterium]|nr:hypothetical protein [Nitrosomonadales bacterium]
MSRVLLIWELGANLGHVGGFIPLAQELRKRGHEPILVLRDLSRVESVMKGAGFPLLQAPIWQGEGRAAPPMSYAEILMGFGFADAEGLNSMVNAWRNLYTLVAPQLLIFDHAPAALLASRGMPTPKALYGTGFYSPPRTTPFPPMRWWMQHPMQQIEANEAQVLAAANAALQRHGVAPLDRLAGIFDVEEDFLCTFRELDHFPARDGNARYWGARYAYGVGHTPAWPLDGSKRVFAYLDKNYEGLERVLQTLAVAPARVLVYAPGISPGLIARYQSQQLAFSAAPVDFSTLGRQCDVVVCNAGHGTVSAVLLAGIPLLLLPGQLEQFLLALNVQNMGAGLLVNSEVPNCDYAAPLGRLLSEPGFGQRAREFAAKYAHESQQDRIARIADRCEELMRPA